MPTAQDFKDAIGKKFLDAKSQNRASVQIISGDLHRELGGYPGRNHRMPVCCEVMYNLMQDSDEIITAPPKGRGASLTIEYHLPRNEKVSLAQIPQKGPEKPNATIITRFNDIANKYPDLAELQDFEKLLQINPRNAIANTRSIAEKIVRKMCEKQHYHPGRASFSELIGVIQNKGVLSRQGLAYLQSIRIHGNYAVHPEPTDDPLTIRDGMIIANIFQELLEEILEKDLI